VTRVSRIETGLGGYARMAQAQLALLALVSFFNYLDRMSLAVLIEPIKRDLALSDTQLGLVTGLAFSLFYAFLGVPIGRLADRGNKGRLLAICFALWSAMTALSGAATSFALLFFARMAVGVGEAGCMPTSFAIISARFTQQHRPLAISIFQAGGLLGIALGMFGAGLVGQLVGWRMTLMLIGAAGLPVALLVALTLGRGEETLARAAVQPVFVDIFALLRRPAFVHVVLGISCASFATYGVIQWLAAFFVRSHGVGLAQIGLFSGLTTGVGGIIGTLTGGTVAGRLARRRLEWDLWWPAAAYAASAPLFVVAVLSPSVTVAFIFNFLGTTVAASAGGVALASVQRFTEPERRATANALMLMISALLGVGLGPTVIGIISDRLHALLGVDSLRWALAGSTVMFLVASTNFLLAARHGGLRGAPGPLGARPVIAS
jgi:predicted MFS family arabinose efflux permease